MKLIKLIFFVVIISIISCKQKEQTQKDNDPQEAKQLKTLENSEIKTLSLTKTSADISSNNVAFSYNGAHFIKDENSILEIDMDELPIDEGLSINMVFNITGKDGKKPQTLLTLVNETYTPNEVFTFYIAGRRLTGIVNNFSLFGNNYSSKEGMSSNYFDSPRLQLEKYYSLTIMMSKTNIQFHINGELYKEFKNLNLSSFKGKKLLIGSYKNKLEANPARIFSGFIRNLEIYNRSMTSDEVLDYYLINKADMKEHNDAVDVKEMESTKQ